MEEFVRNMLNQLHYLPAWIAFPFLFISGVLQSTFPPFPGDEIIILGGFLGGQEILGGIIPIFLVYASGAILATIIFYNLGFYFGDKLFKNKFFTKILSIEKQEKVNLYFKKYGIITFIIGKFAPGINALVAFVGGSAKFSHPVAYITIIAANLGHDILFCLAGYFIGKNEVMIVKFLTVYNYVLIGGISIFIIYLIIKGIKNKKKAE